MKTSVPAPDPRSIAAQDKMADIAARSEARAQQESQWYQKYMDDQSARAKESDDWYKKEILPKYFAQTDKQLAQADAEQARQKELSDYTLGLSKKYDDRYWNTTAKQQDAFYDTVNNYDTAGARDAIGGQAVANVQQALGSQQTQLARALARYGVNPGSGAWTAAMADMNTDAGSSMAYARTAAEQAARAEGLQLRAQAAGLGGNLTGATAGFAGQSSGTASAATGAAGSGSAALGGLQGSYGANTGSWAGLMGGALSGANSGNSAWGALMGTANHSLGNISQWGLAQQQMGLQASSQNSNMFNSLINSGLKVGIGYGFGGGGAGVMKMFGGKG